MPNRVRVLIVLVLFAGLCGIGWAATYPAYGWVHFLVYVAAVVLSSGMKVSLPSGDGAMSVDFPFIFLGLVQLSPPQALALAALSVLAQCRMKVVSTFTLIQLTFNVANVIAATSVAWWVFEALIRRHVEVVPALTLAAVSYFFLNTIPVGLVITWSSATAFFPMWRREFIWYLPFYVVGAILAALADLISRKLGWTTSLLLLPLIYTIHRAYRSQLSALEDRQRHLEETEALHLRTIEGLAMAIEAKDQNTHDHLLRVRVYVSGIGTSLGLDVLQMRALLTAAFLHDIGKLAVPEHIINKPGKLTQEEFEKMKIHPVVGADILERVRFPYPVIPIVRSHHEAWDGSGYPDGLKGEEIPIGARILTVVDCFDALASDRPYRRALPLEEAMAFVRSKSGTQFDPLVVKLLEEQFVQLEMEARKVGEELLPLDTQITVDRGGGPAAGFEEAGIAAQVLSNPASPTGALAPSESRSASLDLIAAASQEAQALFEMSQALGSSLSPNETISVMSARLRRLIPHHCFAVYVKKGQLLQLQYIDGEAARNFSDTCIPIGEGLSGWVGQSGRPIMNGNPKVEPNYVPASGLSGLESALSSPLLDLNGDPFGVLTLYSNSSNAFTRDHIRIIQAIESKFSLSLQNALRFHVAETDAQVDFVTQLPNARQFFFGVEAELNRAERSGEQFGIVVCDLNSFKIVNDLQGHIKGNVLLRQIADGFRKGCRSYDLVARLGGDEFVFLLPGLEKPSMHTRLKSISAVVEQASEELALTSAVSASVGVAFYPKDGATSEELLACADRRMYLDKAQHYRDIAARQAVPVRPGVLAV